MRYFETRHKLLQVVICSMNWQVLGYKSSPPLCAQLGAPIHPNQHSILERVEAMLDHFLHTPKFEGSDLGRGGRAQGKFSDLIKRSQELPWCKLRTEDPHQLASRIHSDLDPYGKNILPSNQLLMFSPSRIAVSPLLSRTRRRPVVQDRCQ